MHYGKLRFSLTVRNETMNILALNTGSSSIRVSLFSRNRKKLQRIAGWNFMPDEGDPGTMLKKALDRGDGSVDAVAHRVVHGGSRFSGSCLITPDVEDGIERLSLLAPLHNPRALEWIRACRALFGEKISQVGVFDTAFFSSLPERASEYALPKDLSRKHGIRRYGFHGIAHRAMAERWTELAPDLHGGGRVISLQLGSGSSVTALRNGTPLDTSMGFSPIEGLVMSTRSGDVDAGALIYLQMSAGFSAEALDRMLNRESGLLGVSGLSGDMRELLQSDHPDARRAIDLYCYRAGKYIGSYLSVLHGCDAILFGGGVGENAPVIRERILADMQWCGIELDVSRNNVTIGREGCISSASSTVAGWVISVDEARVLAQECVTVLEESR